MHRNIGTKILYLLMISSFFAALCPGPGLSEPENLDVKVFDVNYADLESLRDVVLDLKSEAGKVSIDKSSNTLIVMDRYESLQKISLIIERLDARPAQVEITAVIAEVSDLVQNEIGIIAATSILPFDRYQVLLRLLESDTTSNKRSEMTVRTVSNKPAMIRASVSEIFGHVAIWRGEDREIIAPLTIEAGDSLEVLPRVNNDGTILVRVSPVSGTLLDDGSISEKSILTEVIVNDKETIALGGVKESEDVRGRGRRTGRTDVLMFLTVEVVK